MKSKRTRRRITHRVPKMNARMQALGQSLLDQAQSAFELSADLDTAVRDDIAEGLAFIVYAAYDTIAIAECVSDFDSVSFIQQKTYEWFRSREFVEWFCVGASTLFKTTPRCFYRMKVAKAKSGKATVITREKVG